MSETQPRSLVLLAGASCHGVAGISKSIALHSRVTTVDWADLPSPNEIWEHRVPEDAPNLLLTVATEKPDHVSAALASLRAAAAHGVYTGLMMVLRCPFATFLESGNAATDFKPWAETQLASWKHLSNQGRAQHFRIISVEAVARDPLAEVARLMGLFPDYIERTVQIPVLPKPVPKTRIGTLVKNEIKPSFELRIMRNFRQIILKSAGIETDRATLDQISEILAHGNGIRAWASDTKALTDR